MAGKKAVKAPKRTREDSLLTPGELSLFGIPKNSHVPFILPRGLHDYSNPIVDYARLEPGAPACLAGLPKNCTPLAAPSASEIEEEEVGIEIDQDLGEEAESSQSKKLTGTHTFSLFDATGVANLLVEVKIQTRSERIIVEHALKGSPLYLYGDVVQRPNGQLVLLQPELVDDQDRGRLVCRYPSKSKTEEIEVAPTKASKKPPKKKTRKLVLYALNVARLVQERLRTSIPKCAALLRTRLFIAQGPSEWRLMQAIEAPDISIEGSLWQAHHPRSIESGKAAIRALERLSAVEYLIQVHKDRENRLHPPSRIRIRQGVYPAIKHQLLQRSGISMTPEQDAACKEILYDLASPYVMRRALSGDVGTGKTIVFGAVAAVLATLGYLVIIIEPRTPLAYQVYQKLSSCWPDLPYQFIVGDSAECDLISAGIIVGTTAVWSRILSAGLKPDVIICDEQHKLGVAQRDPFADSLINTLEATATPIPRTQGLIEFSGLDVTELRFCHVQKTIHTCFVEGGEAIADTYEHIISQVSHAGKNLAAIYPLVSEDRNNEQTLRSVAVATEFWSKHFPGRVITIHGRMSVSEKLEAIDRFSRGEADVIVGTIVLEVGIDFPRLDIIAIHYPERMGIATAHQLRGRVARKGGEGHCYLVCPDELDQVRRDLLMAMETESDGFRLASLDMVRRGFGDMRPQARQQSGEYGGFLVDRYPTVEDLNFAIENCQEWIGFNDQKLDLFDQSVKHTAVFDAPARTRVVPGVTESEPKDGSFMAFQQLSLLPG